MSNRKPDRLTPVLTIHRNFPNDPSFLESRSNAINRPKLPRQFANRPHQAELNLGSNFLVERCSVLVVHPESPSANTLRPRLKCAPQPACRKARSNSEVVSSGIR